MIERRLKDRLPSRESEHDAKDCRHRKQGRKAPAKADTSERSKRHQDDRPDAEAKEDPARIKLARKPLHLGQGIETPAPVMAGCSEKIVDRNGFVEVPDALADSGNTGPAFRLTDPLRFDKGRQNGDRKIRMPDFDGLIEPLW